VIETDARGGRRKWWTFGGLKANASLAAMLRKNGGIVTRFDNYFVEILGASGPIETERLLEEIRMNDVSGESADVVPPGKIKFWECLPDDLRAQFIRSRFADVASAKMLCSEPRLYLDRLDTSLRG
jgi:ATP-dependent Lhr-like helicase